MDGWGHRYISQLKGSFYCKYGANIGCFFTVFYLVLFTEWGSRYTISIVLMYEDSYNLLLIRIIYYQKSLSNSLHYF